MDDIIHTQNILTKKKTNLSIIFSRDFNVDFASRIRITNHIFKQRSNLIHDMNNSHTG